MKATRSHGLRELWDTGYQTTICKHWHLWLIVIFGQFLEGWYQGFYQYQPFCWNFIKVFRTYHKFCHFQGKRSLDKRRDFNVYVLNINAQEWRHARGILEYANTTIQWEGGIPPIATEHLPKIVNLQQILCLTTRYNIICFKCIIL